MMKESYDPKDRYEALLDLPFGVKGADSPTKAMEIPGNFVVSHEKDPKDARWPKSWARVVRFDREKDRVLLVSTENHHRAGNPPTVWTGTISEYFRQWRSD